MVRRPRGGRQSLRLKMLFGVATLVLVLVVGMLALAGRALMQALNQEVEAKITAVATGASIELVPALTAGDLAAVIRRVEDLDKRDDVRYVAAFDRSGELLYDTQIDLHREAVARPEFAVALGSGHLRRVYTPDPIGGELLTQIAPAVSFDQVVGVVLVGFDRRRIMREVSRLRQTIVALGTVGLAVGLLATVLLARGITGPIERLRKAAVQIGEGDFGRTVEVETRDEIGTLAETFNRMSIELKKREEEVRRSERLSAIGTTASAIAHEMKTPLTTMQTFMEVFPHKYDNAQFRTLFSEQVTPQLTRLGKLVDDMLDYSRETRLHPADMDINVQLHKAATFFNDLRLKHRVSLAERYEADRLVKADYDKMEQVHFNLLKNAIEAAGDGGSIAVYTCSEGEEVVIRIADSGGGIDPAVIAHIFDPFFTTKSKGTGLGLAIVHKIVRVHGGTIRAISPLGALEERGQEPIRQLLNDNWPGTEQGTCFEVRLPAPSQESA